VSQSFVKRDPDPEKIRFDAGRASQPPLDARHSIKRLANDDINFDVRPGEIHCLLGKTGAGKSTLAECTYGYWRADQASHYG
jgi:ABC-type multidrug transport system ATPase subunit